MAFEDDIAGDAAFFDGTETITLRRITGNGAENVSVANVSITLVSKQQQMALGGSAGLDGTGTSFSLPATSVGSAGVNRGDLIIRSDDSIWEVVSCDLRTLDTRWLCVGRRQET